MPLSKYLQLIIGDNQIQVTDPEDLPVSIDYSLEDPDNFQSKPSGQALSLKVPATLNNDQGANTFRLQDVMDLTIGNVFRGNQLFKIIESGLQIMTGKAFMRKAIHNSSPLAYEYDLFGDNADWKVDLEETTMYDLLKHINFLFTKDNIVNSWVFSGYDEDLPYVFAPAKYRGPMGGYFRDSNGTSTAVDNNMIPVYMKPSLSKYWVIYWAFKSVGYRINSSFLDHMFFRRQVMPWSWGNFLDSDGTRLSAHLFLAKSANIGTTPSITYMALSGQTLDVIQDVQASNDFTDGAYDNNNDYTWNATTKEMTWTYNPPFFGILEASFSMRIGNDSGTVNNSSAAQYIQWFKNGVMFDGGWGAYDNRGNRVFAISSNIGGNAAHHDFDQMFCTVNVAPGDVITVKTYAHLEPAKNGGANITSSIQEFKMDGFKIPLGGTIDFANYTGLKKWKFLDFLRGVLDEFNIQPGTDAINKVVTLLPTHSFPLGTDLSSKLPGYFVDDFLDWDQKKDISKDWEMENYSDYDRELIFSYKDDANDGILKKIQDRFLCKLATGKYIFPDRFKTGKKEIVNRFFSPTMHYDVDQWNGLGTGANAGISPQMVCIIPENISNTSNTESSNTFEPKSCYYKGLVTGVGAWQFDGETRQDYPFMFAVNYKDGGENDPVLSYSDERIRSGSDYVLGTGLLKRFYWQRLAIMRNGQWYSCWFRLNNKDVVNQLHREYKVFNGHRWELIQIRGYKPLQEVSTACLLRRWAPISDYENNNTYPSAVNVIDSLTSNTLDLKYAPLKCLIKDIPTT